MQDLKAQVAIIDAQNVKKIEAKLQNTIATNKVLFDDNSKLLSLINFFRISLVEQVGNRIIALSHLHLLKQQTIQVIKQFHTQNTLHQLALDTPRSFLEKMQSWLKVLTKKDIAKITIKLRQLYLRRIWDICKLQNLVFNMDIDKHQLITELGFINKLFNSLIDMKAPKLWEEQDVQGSDANQVANTIQFLEQSFFEKQVLDLQQINELTQEAITIFLHVGRLENILTRFRADIVKIQIFPILLQIDYKNLRDLNKNMHPFLQAELIPTTDTPTKSSCKQATGSNKQRVLFFSRQRPQRATIRLYSFRITL